MPTLSDVKQYQIVNGTFYDSRTNHHIIDVLERARGNNQRIMCYYGNTKSGLGWGGDADTGYVGRSTGMYKVPLCIYNVRSLGGGALLDHCIVKIVLAKGKRVLYQHATYHEHKTEAQQVALSGRA